MILGTVRETFPGERRVALVPAVIPRLAKAGFDVVIESGAGAAAGYPDPLYSGKGARVVPFAGDVFAAADALALVRGPSAGDPTGRDRLALLRPGQIVIGLLRPLDDPWTVAAIARTGAVALAMELVPRITRAQSMDALSSMATVAGYKSVVLAAGILPRMFPMLTTAAGSIPPAKVLVIGAGVAGLQAMATARRLGAVVSGYDIRPAAKEQVQSLGARFVDLALVAADAEDQSGYARGQDEVFYARQRELLGRVVAGSDVVISTAAVPGRKSPLLITADMVARMPWGAVIVDLAAEQGGNCELTRPDETVTVSGVTVIGPTNLPGTIPSHASGMYARNVAALLLHLARDGALRLDTGDEIVRETLLTQEGNVVHARVRAALGLGPEGG
jgi:NAD(P) transhydrogenase subunit alpha